MSLRLVLSRLFALLVAFLVCILLLSLARTLWHSVIPLFHCVFLCLLLLSPLFLSLVTASALVAEQLDSAAACHLDYVLALVAEFVSAGPLSIGGECALGKGALEDRQEDFECLAAAVPRFSSMLLDLEGDPDAPDISTPRSYAKASTGPYSSLWQAAMHAEMASWKSTGTYVDEHSFLAGHLARGHLAVPPTWLHWVILQRFDFHFSLPKPTPQSTSQSLSAPHSNESVKSSGPYPELVGCRMYLMTCTRPDLAYPLSLLDRYVALGRHRKVHWDATKRVLRYMCSTSSMGLVLGGGCLVVLTGHLDASWSTHLSSVHSSCCEAEIYAGAMAPQELRWLTYLLTDLGEQPHSPPVLGTGAAGAGGVGGVGAGDPTEPGAPESGGSGAGGLATGGTRAEGAGAGGAGAGGTSVERTSGLTKHREPVSCPVSRVPTGRHVPGPRPPPVPATHFMALRPSCVPLRVPLPAPLESSLPSVPDCECDCARAAGPTVSRLLATIATDPSFASTSASALVAELVDFAAACRLDYVNGLVAESEFASPPSVGGECALGTDVLEDRQEDFECLAAALPRFASMLLAPEGDPDAPDIPTPRSYAEVNTGPYSSQWRAAMDAEMASWKSTGTYVDVVPPSGANIVDGMWIFRVKQPPSSPPAFKARYVARGFSQQLGVNCFKIFSPSPKMTTLWVLLHVAAQRDYDLHSLEFSRTFLQGSLHEEIWLRRPLGFTGSFPACTQWSLWRQVLQRFGFQFSSPPPTSLFTGHSLSAPPSDESVEPSGPYPDLVGCLIRHRKVHRDAVKRVLLYLCITLGMGLVFGGPGPVVLTGHADASWVVDSATQRSSQGYTFSLGSGSASWQSTRSSSVLSSCCEAEIYGGGMAPQMLRWLTYLLTYLGEQPRLPPQRGQLRLAYVATRANSADIFIKALPFGDHQRFSTVLGILALLVLTGLVTTCSPPLAYGASTAAARAPPAAPVAPPLLSPTVAATTPAATAGTPALPSPGAAAIAPAAAGGTPALISPAVVAIAPAAAVVNPPLLSPSLGGNPPQLFPDAQTETAAGAGAAGGGGGAAAAATAVTPLLLSLDTPN
ncbi:unnamed protein product [Closterium sp. NIES-53]